MTSSSTTAHGRLPPDTRPTLRGTWWIPLLFVVVSLLVLLGTPIVVSYRVRRLQHELSDVTDEARLVVSDFEAALATEMVVHAASDGQAPPADSVEAAERAREMRDERALDTLAGRIGPDAIERFVVMRAAEQRWREADMAARPRGGRNTHTPAAAGRAGADVLAAAAQLHALLFGVSARARTEVRRIEELDVISAAVLAPIALIAAALTFSLGRRLRRFAREADAERAALQRSTELRNTLMHGVTHDIKNPLGAATGYAELLEDGLPGELNEQQRDMVQRIHKLLGLALHTVSDLLELARADAGALHVSHREVDVGALMRELAVDYQAAATHEHLTLAVEPPPSPLSLRTDPARVRQVLENLLSNAIKYTPSGGRIDVRLASSKTAEGQTGRIGIAVADTGPGIRPELRDRIFDEFFRVSATEGVIAGTGLGLAISRRVARLLGGDLTVDGVQPSGSVFTLWLPA